MAAVIVACLVVGFACWVGFCALTISIIYKGLTDE